MLFKRNWGFKPENLVLFIIMITFLGCASVQMPQGGPRDRTPPKLMKAAPVNSTRNFTAKQIRLEFDEYFKLSNQYQEITISPAQEKPPQYNIRGKALVIDFKDSLSKNTTYVINFGKAIVDVNEGNVLKNFTYVFSTGPHIDSLSVTGNVINNLTQEREKEVTVMLFPAKMDTAYYGKRKPAVYATTDTSGNFALNNLHEGDYKIYALKESAPNKIYDNDAELIAFLKKPLHVFKDTANVSLSLFRQSPENIRVVEKRFDIDGKLFFTFNKPIEKPSVKINHPEALNDEKKFEFTPTRDSAMIYIRNMDFDSVSVSFYDGAKILDTLGLRKGRKETFQRNLTFKYNIGSNQALKPNTDLVITAAYPIETLDMSRVVLTEDSAAVNGITLQKDPDNPKKFTLRYRWRQNTKYELRFTEGAFIDMYGGKNKFTIKKFTIDKPENYSKLTLHVTSLDTGKRNYVVQLLSESKVVLRSDVVTQKGNVVYQDFPTGKYRIRVIYDANRNGVWDSGNVKRNLFPENIWVRPGTYTLRPNWEADENLEIPREPVNP